ITIISICIGGLLTGILYFGDFVYAFKLFGLDHITTHLYLRFLLLPTIIGIIALYLYATAEMYVKGFSREPMNRSTRLAAQFTFFALLLLLIGPGLLIV